MMNRKFQLKFVFGSQTTKNVKSSSIEHPHGESFYPPGKDQLNLSSSILPKKQCERCLQKSPEVECINCNSRSYCQNCFNLIHKIGKFQFHLTKKIAKEDDLAEDQQSALMLSTLNKNHTKGKTQEKSFNMLGQMQKNHLEILEGEVSQVWEKLKKRFQQIMKTTVEDLAEKSNKIEQQIEERRMKQIQNLRQKFKTSYLSNFQPEKSLMYSPRKESNRYYLKEKVQTEGKHKAYTNTDHFLNKYYNQYFLQPTPIHDIKLQIKSLQLKKIIQIEQEKIIPINSSRNKYIASAKFSQTQIKIPDSSRKNLDSNTKIKNKSQLHNFSASNLRRSIPLPSKIPLQATSSNFDFSKDMEQQKDPNLTTNTFKHDPNTINMFNAKSQKLIWEESTNKIKKCRKVTNQN